MKNNIKILIVGGTGFIGYHLAKKCLELNWLVTSISTKKPKKIRYLKKVSYKICDISKLSQLKKVINDKNFNYIVNLGGHVDHSNLKKTLSTHYYGLINLTKVFLHSSIKSFIQVGSGGEYGKLKSPHVEFLKIKRLSGYYKAKLYSTLYLNKLNKKNLFPFTVLRLYQAYGSHQDSNRLIPYVINSCLKNKKFNCTHGEQIRDFIFIDDFINLILKCLKNKKAINNIFNAGSGNPIKVKHLINFIKNKIKKGKPQFGKVKLRNDEFMNYYPNIEKSKKILNWRPKISITQGLNQTILFYTKLLQARKRIQK